MPDRPRTALAGLVAALLLVVLAPPGLAAEGTVSIAVVDGGGRDGDRRAAYYVVDSVAPGRTVEHDLEIASSLGAATAVRLYAEPASIRDGRFTFGEAGATSDLVRWTDLSEAELALVPGGTGRVRLRVAVPADAAEGERYGVIWAELPPSAGAAGVVNRVGVRMYLYVGPPGARSQLELEHVRPVTNDAGHRTLQVSVVNRGDRAADLTGSVAFRRPGQRRAVVPLPAAATVAPRRRLVVPVPVPPGASGDDPWEVEVEVVDAAEGRRRGAASIDFPTSGAGAAVALRPVAGNAPPAPLVGVAALGLVLAGGGALRRLRRRRS